MVVELVFFCTMYDDKVWEASPMHVRNNVNGLPANNYLAEWVNTKSGQIEKTERLSHAGGTKAIASPVYSEDIVLRILRHAPNDVATKAAGPLHRHPTNPRYFTDGARQPDGSLKAAYLTGSHTWPNSKVKLNI